MITAEQVENAIKGVDLLLKAKGVFEEEAKLNGDDTCLFEEFHPITKIVICIIYLFDNNEVCIYDNTYPNKLNLSFPSNEYSKIAEAFNEALKV